MENQLIETINNIKLQINDILEELSKFKDTYSALVDDNILTKINTISSNVSTLSANYATLQQTANNTAQLIESNDLDDLTDDLEDVQNAVLTLEQTVNTNNTAHTNSITQINSIITTLQSNITTVQTDISQIQTTIQSLSNSSQIDLSAIQANITSLQNSTQTINTSLSSCQSSITNHNSRIQTNTNNISSLSTQLNQLQNSLGSAIANINSLESSVETIEALCNQTVQNVTSYASTISTLSQALDRATAALDNIDETTENISELETQLTTLQTSLNQTNTNLSTLSNQNTTLSSTVSSLSTTVNGFNNSINANTTNISTLSQDLTALTTRVTTLETSLSSLLQTLSTNACSDAGCGCNYKFSQIESDLDDIKDILALHYPETDPNRIGTLAYTEVDRENNVYCTEDETSCSNMELRKVRNNTLRTFAFTSNATTSGEIDITLDFSFGKAVTHTLQMYINGVLTKEQDLEFTNLGERYHYSFSFTDLTFATGNIVFFYMKSEANQYYYMYGISFKVKAPNAQILSKTKHINIDYFDGKYYISDCRTGTVKYAEIDASKIVRSGNIKLNTLDIQARYYNTFVCHSANDDGTFSKGNTYRAIGQNDGRTCNFIGDYTDGPSYLHSNCEYGCYAHSIPYNNTNICLFASCPDTLSSNYSFAYTVKLYTKRTNFTLSSSAYNMNTPNGPIATVEPIRYLSNYWDYSTNGWSGIYHAYTGNIFVSTNLTSYNTSITYNAGFGVNPKIYCVNPTSKLYDLYYNVFGKIIRKRLQYNTGSRFTLIETEQMGYYDDYFRGVNNDYFVVKNGNIYYYKDPVSNS